MKKIIVRRKDDLKVVIEITTDRGYWSITGHTNKGSCGCVHDKILEVDPSLKMFVDLHLKPVEKGQALDRLNKMVSYPPTLELTFSEIKRLKDFLEIKDLANMNYREKKHYKNVIDILSDTDLLDTYVDLDEAMDIYSEIYEFHSKEFTVGNFRFIHKDIIDNIFYDEVVETIKGCYNLDSIPTFVEIDWDATVENCKADGYGNQFATYDGVTREYNDYYFFIT